MLINIFFFTFFLLFLLVEIIHMFKQAHNFSAGPSLTGIPRLDSGGFNPPLYQNSKKNKNKTNIKHISKRGLEGTL
jgi:hypothetical protein